MILFINKMARNCLTLIRENSQILDNSPINYKEFNPISLEEDVVALKDFHEEDLILQRQKSNKKIISNEKPQQKNKDNSIDLNMNKSDKKSNHQQNEFEEKPEKVALDEIFQEPGNLPFLGLSRSKSEINKRKSYNNYPIENERKPPMIANKLIPESNLNKSKKLKIGYTETMSKLFDKKKSDEKKEKPSKQIINVIKKVVEWRRMSYIDLMNNGIPKMSKEEAAKEL